jgi:hypothetical protein
MSDPTATTVYIRPGRRRSRPDPHSVWLEQLSALPDPPPTFFPAQIEADAWPMLGNDTENCCTCAAAAHMIHAWSAAWNNPIILDEAQVLAAYVLLSQGSQTGLEMIDVLRYWHKQGIGNRKAFEFIAIDPHDPHQLRVAMYLFGAGYIGLALPDFAMPVNGVEVSDWALPATGAVGDAAPKFENGHCVAAIGFDDQRLHVVSCGSVRTMTWDFYSAYNEEAYAVLAPEWYGPKKRTPFGHELTELERDIAILRHALKVKTGSTAAPPNSPSPVAQS